MGFSARLELASSPLSSCSRCKVSSCHARTLCQWLWPRRCCPKQLSTWLRIWYCLQGSADTQAVGARGWCHPDRIVDEMKSQGECVAISLGIFKENGLHAPSSWQFLYRCSTLGYHG